MRPGFANYVVVYLGGDYETAVVTDPFGATAFFLSRTPTISVQEWDRMKMAANRNGVLLWLIGLLPTVQDPEVCKHHKTSPGHQVISISASA
jgi:lipocalin